MRKIKLLGAALLLLCSYQVSLAQKQTAAIPLVRCATDEALQQTFREHPEFKAEYDRKNAQAATQRGAGNNATSRVSTLTGPVTIPVIVHVVLPANLLNIITEEQIDYLLNRLNLDYSGLNPDSTNGSLFYSVRGHSLIRFTRARRTPSGQITNGIERRASTAQVALTTYQAVKHASAGGLDPWDVTQYYNLWVGDAGTSGLLGIAPAIGVGGQTETTASTVGIDGICVDYRGFSNGCFSYPTFALGRTVVHEIGHNFGLYHTFTGCAAGADFAQPTPANQTLPATLVGASADDTPGLSTPTSGCPTGAVASTCGTAVPNPPGKMYQNYMDYTDDPCYSMFTTNQVGRMEYMLETYRPGYLTTQGANPPAGFPALDGAISAVVSPGGSEFNNGTCTITTYPTPTCPGSFVPRISILNIGSTTLTSVTVTTTLTGASNSTQTNTVALSNLLTNRIATIALPAINLALGATTITFTITAVNGSPDTYVANNTATTSVNVALSPLPFTQDFTTTTFPPANMTLFNPNNNNTWVRNAAGNGNVGSAFINNYSNSLPGQIDDIRTLPFSPPTGVTPQDSVVITFDLAHKNYPNSPDILQVLVSTDCGATFTSVYNKSGATLATAGSSTASYLAPIASDWRKERIALGGSFLTGGPIIVAFRNTNAFGNNIFIDNINIARKYDRDISLSAIVAPTANVCTNTFNPQVTVTNNGALAVTGFSVGYRLNGGAVTSQTFTQTINPGASATVTLTGAVTVSQVNNTITLFSFNPITVAGSGDQNPVNDTLTRAFIAPTNVPLFEGFEAATYPPAGWSIIGGSGTYTWVRDNHGHNSSWSIKVDNYNNSLLGQTVSIQTPPLRTTVLDSVIVTFDVAHKYYVGSADVLQVLASRDCGATFVSYYNKSGATLATAGSFANDYVNPQQGDWRTERVAIPFTALNSGSTIIRFQNTNDYGNNVFIDNINITGIYKRDAQLLSINQPANVICNPANTPNVTVRNVGTDTIKSLRVTYVLDNGAAVVSNFTGLNILKNTNQSFNLTAMNAPVGVHTFRAYVSDLVTNSGAGDQYTSNDTLFKSFTVVGSVAAPLVEGFENPTFPPTGWAIVNPDGVITWQRDTVAARTGRASAFVNNYNYPANGSRDELYTPQVTYTGVDSVFLNFDVAATTYSYPGSTAIPLDTLEVLVTNDCGATYTSIYKKWGNELQTVNDPNAPQTIEFIPSGRSQWRNEQLNLSAYASRSPIQLVFRNTTNFENNIFIDNVNVSTKTLPAKLKEQGYLIYPTPFASSFYIQHLLPPTELRGVAVYNSIGQRVWAREYSSTGATSLMQIDLSRYAKDVYTVVLRYTNRTVSQKVIKAN